MLYVDEFSDPVRSLYSDILRDGSRPIVISLDGEIPGAMAVQEKGDNGSISIRLSSSTPKYMWDYAISHELLHVYLIYRGYPVYDIFYDEDSTQAEIGCGLHNACIHRVILEEQKRRGIDTNIAYDYYYSDDIFVPDQKSTSPAGIAYGILNILNKLILVPGDTRFSIYEVQQPLSCEKAKLLYSMISEFDTSDRLATRRAVVKLYKEFDNIARELSLHPLELSKNVLLSFIPRERQLDLTMRQLFVVDRMLKQSGDVLFFLTTILDGQLTLILTPEQMKNVDKCMNMTVRSFYKEVAQQSIYCWDTKQWH